MTTTTELTCQLGEWSEPAPASDGTPWSEWLAASRDRVAALQRQADAPASTPRHVVDTSSARAYAPAWRRVDVCDLWRVDNRAWKVVAARDARTIVTRTIVRTWVRPGTRKRAADTSDYTSKIAQWTPLSGPDPRTFTTGSLRIAGGKWHASERAAYWAAFESWRQPLTFNLGGEADPKIEPSYAPRRGTASHKAWLAHHGVETGPGVNASRAHPAHAIAQAAASQAIDLLTSRGIPARQWRPALLLAPPASPLGRALATLIQAAERAHRVSHLTAHRDRKTPNLVDPAEHTATHSIAIAPGGRIDIGTQRDHGQTRITDPRRLHTLATLFAAARNTPRHFAIPEVTAPKARITGVRRTSGAVYEASMRLAEAWCEAAWWWHEWTGQPLSLRAALRAERPSGGRPPVALERARELALAAGVPVAD